MSTLFQTLGAVGVALVAIALVMHPDPKIWIWTGCAVLLIGLAIHVVHGFFEARTYFRENQ